MWDTRNATAIVACWRNTKAKLFSTEIESDGFVSAARAGSASCGRQRADMSRAERVRVDSPLVS